MENRSRVLLIVDVQIGLVDRMTAEVQRSCSAQNQNAPHVGADSSDPHPACGTKRYRPEAHTKGWEICRSLNPAEEGEHHAESANRTRFRNGASTGTWKKTGITNLIVAGGMAEYCVDTDCRRALSLGYDVTLASDAHLTRR
jgi:nicotinamidase-related amidase